MKPRLSRLLTVVAATAAAGVVVGSGSGVAFADDGNAPVGRVDHVQSKDGQVQVLFSVPGLPADVSPDPSTVEATFNGDPLDASASSAATGTAIKRVTVLTMDVSNSMRGAKFEAAKQAAEAYIDTAPSDVYIGLVTFASTIQTVKAPTQDHDTLTAAIDSLTLTQQTRLYDGIVRGLDVAGKDGSRSLLVLSDGKNNVAGTSDQQVIAKARKAGVRIDAVGLDQSLTGSSPLGQIARSTKGRVTSTADPDKLRALFASEANDLAKQIIVTFATPTGLDSLDGTLSISVEADGARYDDQAFVTLPAPAGAGKQTYASGGGGLNLGGPWFMAGVVMLFLGLVVLLGFGLQQVTPKAATPMQQQLSLYTVHGMRRSDKTKAAAEGHVDIKGAAVAMTDRLVMPDLEDKIAKKLDAGGLKLKPAEWLLLHGGIVIGAPLIGLLILGPNPIVILLFLMLGAFLPFFYLSFKASRRIKAFNGGLAETLQIIAGGLQAGLSLSQAIDTVVKEGTEPIASEFQRAIIEQRLGVEIEESLETVAERMESVDFKWVVMAIRIQREVGGNLAELLLTVSATLREREYLRRQVAVLSAEGRLSAWILGGLPPFFVAYLTLTRPTYVAPMFHTNLGLVMCGLGIAMMLVGAFWLKKAVKVVV